MSVVCEATSSDRRRVWGRLNLGGQKKAQKLEVTRTFAELPLSGIDACQELR